MATQYFFRCKTNPKGPLLTLESFQEADEMKNHPDYERVDEFGEVIVSEDSDAPHPIPFHAVGGRK
jgi:hypothetical protein